MTAYNGVYTSIDITGGTQIQAVSINATGQIVGNYVDSSFHRHGFLDNGGTLTFPIDVPGSTVAGGATLLESINDSGWILGIFENPNDNIYGFGQQGFLDIGGTFSTIDVPNSVETAPSSMSAYGIVGYYQGSGGVLHGFLDVPTIVGNSIVTNNFTTIDGQANNTPGHATFTFASGINASGLVIGYYYDTSPIGQIDGPQHGFLYNASTTQFTTIDPTNSTFTQPTAINATGQIVGFFQAGAGAQYEGFLDSGGTITTVDVPGAVFTQALSINDSGQIVGVYEDSTSFQLHGFIDINGTFSTIDVPGSTLTEALSINNRGQIVDCGADPRKPVP